MEIIESTGANPIMMYMFVKLKKKIKIIADDLIQTATQVLQQERMSTCYINTKFQITPGPIFLPMKSIFAVIIHTLLVDD